MWRPYPSIATMYLYPAGKLKLTPADIRRRRVGVDEGDHVLGHARLSDIDAELEQFSMDSRRSPQRIGNAHLADELAYLQRSR